MSPKPVTPVKVEQGVLLLIGVPHGDRGQRQTKRAISTLQREGFRVAQPSDETVRLLAQETVETPEPRLFERTDETKETA